MVNKVQIIGRLGSEPEAKTISSGKTVTRFNVATSEFWVDRDGQKQERTEWHKVVVWNELAVNCERFLKKGLLVYVEGRIQTRSWETDQGEKRYTTEVVGNSVKFLEKASEGNKDFGSEPSFDSNEEIPF